jgi:fumarylpyruvate hydrolase
MTNYLFDPPATVALPVAGQDVQYPVNRIFCVGRNYAAHANEMGSEADKENPFYFTKHPSSIVISGARIPYPPMTENYHYEMEMVAAIGAPVFRADPANALDAVWGYSSGLDMTRRDLQLAAREKGRPWDTGKDFEQSAVISPLVPVTSCGHINRGRIELRVNGETKQQADIADLINDVAEIVVHLSGLYQLQPGDLIYTGTPAGVGPVQPGDVIEGSIEGLNGIELYVE